MKDKPKVKEAIRLYLNRKKLPLGERVYQILKEIEGTSNFISDKGKPSNDKIARG